jgi:hypothetical protein
MALPEWCDARAAAIFLRPCTPKHLNEELGPMLYRKTGNKPGTRTAGSGGWLYHRHDLERVRAVMDALGCKPLKAAWLFRSIKVLGERRMLPYLAQELELTLNQTARRFQ